MDIDEDEAFLYGDAPTAAPSASGELPPLSSSPLITSNTLPAHLLHHTPAHHVTL